MLRSKGAPRLAGAPFFYFLLAFIAVLVQPARAAALRDLAYGPDPAQRMDVYMPAHSAAAPILLLVHGGAWKIGDKRHHAVIAAKTKHWTAKGFVVVSTNYRLNIPPDQQAADISAAVAEIERQASHWHADPGRLIVMGHSAGAHLLALLHARLGDQAPWRAAVLLDSAALDVPAIMTKSPARFYRQAFGRDPRQWQALSPWHQLHDATKPVLAVCSSYRRESCAQAKSFVTRTQQLGGTAQLLPQPLSHRQINENLGSDKVYTAAVDHFIAGVVSP